MIERMCRHINYIVRRKDAGESNLTNNGPEITRIADTIQYSQLIKFRIHPASRTLIEHMRACNGYQVICDDHAEAHAASKPVLKPVSKRLVCLPSAAEEDMAFLDVTSEGKHSDEANLKRIHGLYVESQRRVLTDLNGFAELV